MVAKITTIILGQEGGHSKRCFDSVLSTSMAEAFHGDSCWSFAHIHCQMVHPRHWEGDWQWTHSIGGEDQGLDCFLFLYF
jgi:hypothetical protein